MKATLLIIGILLVVIGLLMSSSPTWMWTLIVLGAIGVIWGLMTKGKSQV
jgi:uncharacterized membrane protein